MRSKLLITSAAAALVAGTVLAAGQGMPKQQPGGADRGATQERTEGQGQRGEPGGKAQQGQPEEGRKGGEQGRQGQREQGREGERGQSRQGERDEQPQGGKQKAQKAQRDEGPRGAKAQGQRDEAPKNGTAQQGERDEGQKGKQQGQREERRRGSQQGQAEGRQKGGGSSVTLTTEQRTRIRETIILSGSGPKVTRVTFPVRVGTVIPRSVRVVEVPELIIEIHPEWRSFRYFVYEDEIVIVDPNNLRIVAVIAV